MTNYQMTFGYTAVITVSVKAENEDQAREKAVIKFKKGLNALGVHTNIQDDTYGIDGVLNMDKTYNKL